MAFKDNRPIYHWNEARGLMPSSAPCENGPQGALVPDYQHERDHIAVVYDKGDTPPQITIREVSGTVHAVFANGVAVAVVASSRGMAPDASEVILLERAVHPS